MSGANQTRDSDDYRRSIMEDRKAKTSVPIHDLLAKRWSPRAFDAERQVSPRAARGAARSGALVAFVQRRPADALSHLGQAPRPGRLAESVRLPVGEQQEVGEERAGAHALVRGQHLRRTTASPTATARTTPARRACRWRCRRPRSGSSCTRWAASTRRKRAQRSRSPRNTRRWR